MWYDLLILAIIIFAAIRGAMKGFVWQLATIAALVLCFLFATPLSLALAPAIGVQPPLNRWIALAVIYALFSLLAFGGARMLREGIEKAKFVEYDRHLGSVFGLLKGVVIALVLTFFAVTLSESARAQILETRSGYVAAIIMDRLHPVMPAELHDVLEPYIHQLDRPGLDLRHSHHDDHHDDGHGHAHDDPFERDPSVPTGPAPIAEPFEPNNRPPAYEPVRRAESENVWVFAASLIGQSNEQVREEVLRYVASTTPEERSRLIEQLGLAIPNLVQIIAPSGSPQAEPVAPAPAERPSSVAAERDRLLGEITSVYSDFRNAQEAMAEEVIVSLAGVPDQVVLGVLRDWRADLLSIDRSDDPDAGTSINTPLDVRIVRQLSAARVPLSSLDPSLQSRLRRTERR